MTQRICFLNDSCLMMKVRPNVQSLANLHLIGQEILTSRHDKRS